MNRLACSLIVLGCSMGFSAAAFSQQEVGKAAEAPAAGVAAEPAHVDVVFCIDRSKSMAQVIETAKQKVWAIVNQIARAKPAPILRIGLIGYGDGEKLMHQLQLTDDLDEVYKNLMTYHDDSPSGAEFVGHAIHVATNEMKWSEGKQVLRLIYVIGNETARQGPSNLDYAVTAPAAIKKGIQVNAIYCGTFDYETAPPTWREFAKLADGQYMEIAGTGGAIVLATPFDKELDALSAQLNTTYIHFGERGQQAAQNQAAQDKNAQQLGASVAADRALSKAQYQYRNSRWDLVDALAEENFDLSKVKDDQLPDEVKKLPAEKRKAYIESKGKERKELQTQIKALAEKRQSYIDQETRKQKLDDGSALDKAVKESLTEQAEKKGFKF